MKTGEEHRCDRCGKTWIIRGQAPGPSSFTGVVERQGHLNYNVMVNFKEICVDCDRTIESLLGKIEHSED